METFNGNCRNQFCFVVVASFGFWFFMFYFHSFNAYMLMESKNHVQSIPNQYANSVLRNSDQQGNISSLPIIENETPQPPKQQSFEENRAIIESDPCSGRYVYVHDLPSRFNVDILKDCKTISMWTDMCKFISNMGLGPKLSNEEGAFSNKGWFATNQFAVELIFYNRMKQYKCLTSNSSMASAIFVPFFAGLDISRYLWGGFNTTTRDSSSFDLVEWLVKKPEWQVLGGRDHFLVGGRITWDFRRQTDNETDWGNKFLFLPQVKNMTILTIESSPWSSYDFGIPYPTYFHPSKDIEVFQWQNRMRRQKRLWWFSFAGAPRPNMAGSIRGQIINQCRSSKRCKLLECSSGVNQCNSPSSLMKLFQRSIFCLQPQGDSYTRRSAFDSILAGCIPVFFHPGSAYVQYTWHLPLNHTSYSVFIPEDEVRDGKISIETVLLSISREEVRGMREKIIELIPRIIYADPRSRLETLEDAFDIAVQGVIQRVNRLREGRVRNDMGFVEENHWKYALIGGDGEHEWDRFFTKPEDAGT
ncbi:hypothetical protein AAC387_Pa03g2421 [Persea americana]